MDDPSDEEKDMEEILYIEPRAQGYDSCDSYDSYHNDWWYKISSGSFRDYEAQGRNHLRALAWKFFVNQDYSSSSFLLKLLCLKSIFKCFPVISFQFFLRCRAPSGLPKVWGLELQSPWLPLKTTTENKVQISNANKVIWISITSGQVAVGISTLKILYSCLEARIYCSIHLM